MKKVAFTIRAINMLFDSPAGPCNLIIDDEPSYSPSESIFLWSICIFLPKFLKLSRERHIKTLQLAMQSFRDNTLEEKI